MPVNQKKTSIIAKRQRSIFEFTQTGNDIDVQNSFNPCEVIDLTDDAESFGVKLEQEEINTGGEIEAMGERELDVDAVNCPMCNRSLVDFSMDNRILHIEECLSLVTLKEDVPTITSESSDLKKEEINGTNKSDVDTGRNKRKIDMCYHQIRKEKYLNKKPKSNIQNLK